MIGYDVFGEMVDGLLKDCLKVLMVSVPLAIWKVVDIIVWCYSNIHIGGS